MNGLRSAAFILASLAVVAACSDDARTTASSDLASTSSAVSQAETTPPPTTAPPTPPTTVPVTSAAATSTTLPSGVIEVAGVEYAFGGLPERVAAGSQLVLFNLSTTEVHEMILWRIADAETRPLDELVAESTGEFTFLDGPPLAVSVADPGEFGVPVEGLGDGTLDAPGRYFVYCAIPTGLDPAELHELSEASGGPVFIEGVPPHFEHGMFAEVYVD